MKKMRLRKKHKFKKHNLIIITIVMIIFALMFLFNYINKLASPILLNYAEVEMVKLSSYIINKSVSKEISSNIKPEEIYTTVLNNDGEIVSVDFNPISVNKILSTTNNIVQLHLRAVENGDIDFLELPENVYLVEDTKKLKKGIIYEIPIGIITNNVLLSNVGPKIPIRLMPVGSVSSTIETEIKQYGINNALIEIFVSVSVSEKIIMPFNSKTITVSSKIPVAMKIMQGKIPEYYGGTMNSSTAVLDSKIE